MIRFRSLMAGVVIAGLLGTGAAFAQAPGDRGPGGRGRAAGPARTTGLPLGQLKLTDSQRQQVRDLVQKQRQAGEPLRDRLRAAETARRAAMDAIPVNEGAIRSTTADLVAAQTDLAIHQARLRADIFALLTPEQQDRVRTLQNERRARAEQRRERQAERPARQRQR